MPLYRPEETDRLILQAISNEAQHCFEIDPLNTDYPPHPEAVLRCQGYIRGLTTAWSIFNQHSIELLPGGTQHDDTPAPWSSYRYKPHESAKQQDNVDTWEVN